MKLWDNLFPNTGQRWRGGPPTPKAWLAAVLQTGGNLRRAPGFQKARQKNSTNGRGGGAPTAGSRGPFPIFGGAHPPENANVCEKKAQPSRRGGRGVRGEGANPCFFYRIYDYKTLTGGAGRFATWRWQRTGQSRHL